MSRPPRRSSHRANPRLRLLGDGAAALLCVALVVAVATGMTGSLGRTSDPVEAPEAAPVGRAPAAARLVGQEPSATPRIRWSRPAKALTWAPIEPKPEPEPEPKPEPEPEPRTEPATTPAPFSLRVGTFNVLGSQHTDADGSRRGFPPASVRTARAAALVAKHDVDVLGTQELQDDQLRGLQSRTGMAAYPGLAWGAVETDNSILWDPAVFELVSGSRFTITFVSRPRPQPVVRLRHRATGQELYVVNTHPSPGGGKYLTQRRNAQAALVALVGRLRADGLPVLVTGDMNDREEFFCRAVAPAGMTAANGGSTSAGCRPPPSPLPVDWVVGSGVGWSGYWRDTTPVTQRTSDHFFISATAHVG